MAEVTWVKEKYTVHKRAGRFRSSHNDSTKRTRRVSGRSIHTPPPGERVLVVDAATGARHWVWR